MNPITERMLKVVEWSSVYGIYSVMAFEHRTGLAGGTVSRWSKGRDASVESVMRILDAFSAISAEWLLRGTGEMLLPKRSQDYYDEPSAPSSPSPVSVTSNDYVRQLEAENKFLREQLSAALTISANVTSK